MNMFNEIIQRLKNSASEEGAYVIDEYGHSKKLLTYSDVKVIETALKELNVITWIPVSRKLPKESDWYVVTRIHGRTGRKFVCRAFFDENDQEFNELNVIAWQPMPEPYEGE